MSVLNLMPSGEAVVHIVLVCPFRPARRASERRFDDGRLPERTDFLTAGFNKGFVTPLPPPVGDDRKTSIALRHGHLPRMVKLCSTHEGAGERLLRAPFNSNLCITHGVGHRKFTRGEGHALALESRLVVERVRPMPHPESPLGQFEAHVPIHENEALCHGLSLQFVGGQKGNLLVHAQYHVHRSTASDFSHKICPSFGEWAAVNFDPLSYRGDSSWSGRPRDLEPDVKHVCGRSSQEHPDLEASVLGNAFHIRPRNVIPILA
ncbi:hypothetical protein SAMN05216321_101149 [Cupriavidus sp. OV038]|nr:hypothetical protein SAMN05216321_101149 [Cupriavidus sp. OV038]SFO58428.1 hypothetical protein SAMN05216322_101149 [Cupriavidus sp. OV096]